MCAHNLKSLEVVSTMIGYAESGMLPFPAGGPSSDLWASLVDNLHRIRTYEDDWDGDGSAAPGRALVDAAIEHARMLAADGCPPADRVHASVNGTIYFEWHSPLGYQEIEMTSPTEAHSLSLLTGSREAFHRMAYT